jgi:hypothetical protein
MSVDADLSIIYSNMLAGCVPIGNAQPERVISLLAQDILDTPHIHTTYDVKDGHVYYLAVPSKQLTSEPRFSSPLAAAFSGHSQYQGDGVYLLRDAPNGYAAIRRGSSLRLLVNHLDLLEDALIATELPIYDVSNLNPWPLVSTPWLYRTAADQMSGWITKISLVVLAGACMVLVVSEMTQGVLSARKQQSAQSVVEKANIAISQAKLSNPLSRQLTQIQNVSSTVVRAGGWVEQYRIKGQEENFLVALPTWVSKDYLDSLGKGVTSERQDAENLIWVRKGAIKGDANKIASKATPVAAAAPAAGPAAPGTPMTAPAPAAGGAAAGAPVESAAPVNLKTNQAAKK